MRLPSTRTFALLVILVSFAASAQATPHITPTGSPCGTGCEPTIFDILAFVYPTSTFVRIDDGDDQLWENLGLAGAKGIAKFAGLGQDFGYLDGSDVFHSLFTATDPSDYLAPSSFVTFSPGDSGNPFRWASDPSSADFWTSLEANNVDPGTCLTGSCVDHSITFLITSGPSAGNYVVGFEDLPYGSDRDFNDIVVEVTGARHVPEPGSAAVVLLGLLSLGARAVRRRG